MEKKRFSVVALVLGIVLIVSLTACGGGSSGEDAPASDASNEAALEESGQEASQYKFAFSGSELANPWVAMVKDGFEAACKDNGIEFVSLNAGSDVNQQVADIENSIEGGYNAIVFNPIDGSALDTVLKQATDQGIPSVTIAQIAASATAGIELDDYAYGEVIATQACEWINENLDGKAEVAVLAEDNIESSIQRGNAIEDTIKKMCPDATIVARQQANTPEQGLEVVESLLLKNPDLNVIVACNDSGGIGGYQAMENAGLATEANRAVFSGDNTSEAVEYIKVPDSIYRGTADLFPYESGYKAVEMSLEYLKNGFPSGHESIPLGMGPVSKDAIINGIE
jgi:ribose transport system substrate-binding protein